MPAAKKKARPVVDHGGRVGVVDIGSNSIRLVVFEALKRVPVQVFNEKVLCGLGRGLEGSGKLSDEGMALALPNLERFTRLAEAMGVESIEFLATAAVREASNRDDFIAEVEARCGREVQVLSGAEEARLAALGVLSGEPHADGVIGDLGGGSLELIEVREGVTKHAVTLPLGALKLRERFGDDIRASRAEVKRQLHKVEWLGAGRGRNFYPVGGAWRNLARIHMAQMGYPLAMIHGYKVSRRSIQPIARLISDLGPDSLAGLADVPTKRLEILPHAAVVLERLLREIHSRDVICSTFGLREGFLFDRLSPEEQALDPLLEFTGEILARAARSADMGALLETWTAPLFPNESKAEARLRRAACDLSDIAWRDHADFRAEQAQRRILFSPLLGVTHRERVFIAYVIRVRYGGVDIARKNDPMKILISEEERHRAEVLGLAFRLAYRLSGGTGANLDTSALRLAGNEVELDLPADGAMFYGDLVTRRMAELRRAVEKRRHFIAA